MEIQQEVNDILHSHFEIPHSKLVRETHIYRDLGLDSLDAADMLVLLEAKTGMTIMPESFMDARTLDDVYRLVALTVDLAKSESEVDRNGAVNEPTTSESSVLRSG